MKKTTFEPKGKGHFEIEFEDGLCGLGMYDTSLPGVIDNLSRIQNNPEQIRRIVKSITWVEEDKNV